ncbi:MAG: RHS repeat-associated core domain-containing protein, partial [Acholeplasmatales bacterium]|nr:RHS repeat-associated core domain-containing protein [Acholeplasmatales bacterium]
RDVLNNIIGIIDNNGLIVSKFDYDAYGNIINQTGTIMSNFRYKGYYYDTDIELYYLKTRFYNPVLLRFITPDSIEYLDSSSIIGLNLYAYCGNDPINMKDEEGNLCFLACLAIGALVGAIVGFGTSLASEAISNGGVDKVNWGIVASSTIFGAIDGALSVTGLGPIASVAISGVLAGIQYTVEQAISGDDFSINGFFLSVGIGALASAIMPNNFNAKKMTGIYKTSKDYLKTLVSKSKRAMYNGKIKGVYKTIAKKSAFYAVGSAVTSASDEVSKYIFGEFLGWL